MSGVLAALTILAELVPVIGHHLRSRFTLDRPTAPGVAEDDYALPSVTVDYQLPVPRSDMHLLLTFSSPLVQIADAMAELFDAIAGSLVWKEH
ncbi:hypothetical protein QQY24_13170 [Streptomyces sp. TG1A-8]|uniref:hypothetical protein n=1 Tax=Streptomyces sp. TG1A-8 TaxID=3051385 RepID=UPI00265BC316|nr:hypothetical protein [Streptomyces sp. TG1A-8]MDO0926328.1 hypothetical protein [Streptomyces sp. TG1A-8]